MSRLASLFGIPRRPDGDQHWLSISDLMAGLMMVFLLIAVAYMLDLRTKVDAPVRAEQELCGDIQDLQHRLDDLIQIGEADVCPQDGPEPSLSCLTVRFPTEGLFAQGEAEILPAFRRTLDEFFPQYLQVLQDWATEEEGRAIREVRIEGHSSSEWERDVSDADAFFFNMALSQGRTRSVLEHIYGIARERSDGDEQWVKERVRAVGYSSSQPVTCAGQENPQASRRVLFRVATNLEDAFRGLGSPDASRSDVEER